MASKIKERLRTNQTTIGSWMLLPNSSVAEIMGRAGFDFVAVDLEHGSFGNEGLADIFRALELGGTAPFARVAEGSCKDIKAALEAGARGLIIPMIETRQQMEQAIAWAKYADQGVRGVGFSRANLFGKHFSAYLKGINDELVMVAQIESIRAIPELEGIMALPGVDAVIVGPYDLSASMGLTAQFTDPRFLKALDDITAAAARQGVPMGIHVVLPDPALLKAKIAEGYRFIAYGSDAVFLHQNAGHPAIEPS